MDGVLADFKTAAVKVNGMSINRWMNIPSSKEKVIQSEFNGRLVQINVKVGDKLKKDDIIARVSDEEIIADQKSYEEDFLRISTLPYDLMGLINFIYSKEYKFGDVIDLLNNPNKKFDGIDGNFYFKNNMIERNLNILKISNGNSFVIN